MKEADKRVEIHNTKQSGPFLQRILGAIFCIIEVVLAFRMIFKLLGANAANGFVHGIYYITQFLVGLFEGIFSQIATGVDGAAVFEPATLIAIIIVGVIAWIVLDLISSGTKTSVSTSEVQEHKDL